MKENRKLLKEVLKDIRHDMTDEEVLSLLADSQDFRQSGERKRKVYAWTACGGCYCEICRELGVYLLVYRRPGVVDDDKYGAGSAGV